MGFRWIRSFGVAGAIGIAAASGFFAGRWYERDQNAMQAALAAAEPERLAAKAAEPENAARAMLSRTLKDPTSILLRSVYRRGDVLCGMVNGKNSLGGYVGFAPFFIEGDRVEVLPSDIGDWPFDVVDELDAKCADKNGEAAAQRLAITLLAFREATRR
jgi:hypothetical protein